MGLLPTMCRPWDVCLALPWFNRQRPYFGFHVALCGHRGGPRPATLYHVGVGVGRQFTHHTGSGGSAWKWFNVAVPRKART